MYKLNPKPPSGQSKISRIDKLSGALKALSEYSESIPELKPSLRHALNIKNSVIGNELLTDNITREELIALRNSLENTFLIRFMPESVEEKFEVNEC